MMREFVAGSAKRGTLDLIDPAHVANTFGNGKILVCEVEAEMLKHPIEGGEGQMTLVADIQRAVAAHYGLPEEFMRTPSGPGKNAHAISHPRQVAMYLATKLTNHSMARIGFFFGGRDHTTIIHARMQVIRRMNKIGPTRFAVAKLTHHFDKRVEAKRACDELRDAILAMAA
jgi:chromosomal replication initiation ATPase DnaA